jgi:hypothetical protein
MLEWGTMRINNTLIWWNEVPWESTIPQYVILVSPYSSICYCRFSSDLKYCWFSSDFILASQCVIDSHATSFKHTIVFMIIMVPIQAFWLIKESRVALFQHTDNTLLCWHEITWELITHWDARMKSLENQQYFRSLENRQ